jgi:LmbE family N-acetylglucosaminyl deacetylase
MNRDDIRRGVAEAAELGIDIPGDGGPPDAEDEIDVGLPEELITHAIDVRDFLDLKRQVMRAHASQIAEDSFFLALPDEIFERAFGTEWFVERGNPRDGEPFRTALLP